MKIKSNTEVFLRHIAYLAVGILTVLSGFVLLPFRADTSSAATSYVASETTLTVDTEDIVVNAKTDVNNLNTFFTATSNLEIITNNYSGYTLRISAEQEQDHDKLLGENDAYLASIEQATTEADFKEQSSFIGKFGYKPSKLNSDDNTNYLPAPDSTGDVLDVTSTANSTSNSYAVSLAARVDMSITSGEYSNVYVYTVVANPVPYMIQYDGNTTDTVNNLPDTQVDDTTDEDMTLSDNIPTREHYTFAGWCDGTTTAADNADTCNGDVYQPGDSFYLDHTTNNSTTLKAMWSINRYDMELDGLQEESSGYTIEYGTVDVYINGVKVADDVNEFVLRNVAYGTTYEVTDFKPLTGRRYNGPASISGTIADEDLILNLDFSTIDYIISYDLGGGSVATPNKTTYNIDTDTFTLANPTRAGYSFKGWSGTDLTGDANQTVTIAKGSIGDRSYTANWEITPYTISYELNGGSVSTANPTGYNVETDTFTLNNPTRSGYTFKGWSGTGLSGDSNQTVTITKGSTGNRSYTANWTAIDYTITVKAGNGISTLALSGWTNTGTGTLTKTFHIGDTVNLASFTPAHKTGYSGKKYAKNSGSGTLSSATFTVGAGNAELVINATTLDTPTCQMVGGGTKVYNRGATTLTATDNSGSYDTGSVDVTYSFGWATSSTADLANFIPAQSGNTITIAKNGSLSQGGTTVWTAYRNARHYGVTVVVTDKNDSTITATCTSGTGSGTSAVANRTYLTLVNARINFNAGEGTLSGTAPVYVYYQGTAYYTGRTNAAAASLPTATRTGYTFDGWFTSDDVRVTNADGTLTGTAVSGWTDASKRWVITSTTNNETVNMLYAHYTPDTYTITLNGNGGTLGSSSTTATYDSTTLGTITNPTWANTTGTRTITEFTTINNNASGATITWPSSGCTSATNCKSTNTTTHTFNGWYKETGATNKIASNATTPVLQANTDYTDAGGKWTSTSGQTLYAGWTNTASDYSSVTLPTITKTGYTCGWTTTETGATTIPISSGASYIPSANTRLYGVCTASQYTITLTNTNATISGSTSVKATYDSATLSANITKPQRVYTVSGLSANGSDGSGATVTFPSSGCTSASNCKHTYVFNGWYTATSNGSKVIDNSTNGALVASVSGYTDANKKWIKAGTAKLYAQWGDNDGITLPTITKTGYTCGWATANNTTTRTYSSGQTGVILTADATLYGTCTANQYTVTLNKSGATNTPTSSVKVTYGATTLGAVATKPVRVYTISGMAAPDANTTVTFQSSGNCTSASECESAYAFNGWYKESGATNLIASNDDTPALQASTSYTNASKQWTSASNQTLYAGWTAQQVTLPTITRTGYTCKWHTKPDGTGTSYNSGAAITPTANLTLTGICTARQYTITLSQNNATTDSDPTSVKVTYDTTTLGTITTLPVRQYTISGMAAPDANTTVAFQSSGNCISTSACTSTYEFNGWYKESGATNLIASKASTPVLQANTTYTDANGKWTYAGNRTLYAGWTGQSVKLPTITRTGYTCGWVDQDDTTYTSGKTFTPTKNLTLTGSCTANTYSLAVNFDGNGVSSVKVCKTSGNCSGSNLMGTVSTSGDTVSGLVYNTAYYLYPAFSTGYEFSSWAKNSGKGTLSATDVVNPTFTIGAGGGTVTVTGQAKTYEITLNRNGGNSGASTTTTATYGSTKWAAITVPTKSDTTSTRTVSGFTEGTNASGATISSTSTLSSTRTTTYTFDGWYTAASDGTKVANNASTPALTANNGYTDDSKKWNYDGTATFYAQYTSTVGSWSSVKLPTITKTGYTCGWSTSDTATSISYNSGANFTPSKNTTLYGICVDTTLPSEPTIVKGIFSLSVQASNSITYKIKVKSSDTSGSSIKYTYHDMTAGMQIGEKTCANNTDCTINVDTGVTAANKSTKHTYQVCAEDAAENVICKQNTEDWSPQQLYVHQLYGGFRALWGGTYNVNQSTEIDYQLNTLASSNTAYMISAMYNESEPRNYYNSSSITTDQKCENLYHAILGRAIDNDGLTSCRSAISGGRTFQSFATELANSSEAQAIFKALGLPRGTTPLP